MAEQTLAEFFEESETVDEQELLSRRRFLTGAVAGGAAGLAVAAGTGVAVWKVADAELLAAREAAEAELLATKEVADSELARLQGLVDLYEDLEKIGLDAVLETGMMAVALPLEALEVGAETLRRGLEWAEKMLLSLEEALPSARESLHWLEDRVSAVADGIERLEAAASQTLGKATNNPVGEAMKDFANTVLDYLPFGLGDRFRLVLDRIVHLVTSIDELIEGINDHLLEPLHEKWFSSEDGKGVGTMLVEPLVVNILDPLEVHLVNLSVVAKNWQSKLMSPTQEALAERERIREKIVEYKETHGLG